MKLVVGLGNPGERYQLTRHNLGFEAVSGFTQEHSLTWQKKDKFKALVAEGTLAGQKAIFALPTTFYNLAGEAVQAIMHFYKIPPSDLLVVHDELALPFGAIRTRRGGSDAGNNGLKSIIAAIGPGFARLRIGIANEQLATQDAADFVLSRFNTQEQSQLEHIKKHAITQIGAFISGSFGHTTVKM